jgi:plasmid segregation protein ParM
MIEVLALDIGYGYTKGMTAKKQGCVASLVGPAEAIRYESDVHPENGKGIVLEVNGRSYFVGEQAEVQSASASQTLDVTRTGSKEQKALFYAVSSDLIPTTAEQVAVVTGLPVGDFDPRRKALLKDMLAGQHEVVRQGKHRRCFEVTSVYIMPQAFGSLYALVLDRRGKLIDGDLADGRVGIVDIGMHTANFILADRLRYVEVGSDSITSGMGELLQKVAKDLKREHDLDWSLQLGRVDRAVRERTVESYGAVVNIAGLIQPHLEALADTVVSKARTLWGPAADLRAIVLTGGGSHELAPYVRKVYTHTRTVGGDPQFANCTGYLRIGLRRFGE